MKLSEVHSIEGNITVNAIINSDIRLTSEIAFLFMMIMTNINFGGAKYCKNNAFSKLRNLRSINILVVDRGALTIYNSIQQSCNILLIKTETVIVKNYKYLHIITVLITE